MLLSVLGAPGAAAQGRVASQAASHDQKQPNVLVFVADDAGWRDFGAYGSEVARTPHIDRLTRDGLKVERAFLTTSSCSPSRISMLSGYYPHETGTEDLHTPVPDSLRLLPAFFSERDYYTGLIGKSHIGRSGQRQFDFQQKSWRETSAAKFERFLEAADGRPFFLWTAFIQPHRPFGELTTDAPALALAEKHDPSEITVQRPHLADRPDTRADLARYHDAITRMDKTIGHYIEVLQEHGLRENTLIVFVSDNGAPLPREKGSVYDAGVRTPLIFQGPGVEAGTTYGGLVSLIDFAPTLLAAAGLDVPEAMTGRSIAEIFSDQDVEGRAFAFSERNWHDTDAHIRTVRTDEYRFVLNGYPDRSYPIMPANPSWRDLGVLQEAGELTPAQARLFEHPRPRVELYDVSKDPYQVHSVADEATYSDVAERLAKALQQWREQTSDHPPFMRRRPDIMDRITGLRFRWDRPPAPPFIERTLQK